MIKSDLAKKRRERIIRYAPLFLWIVVILFASTTQGAMSNTSRFIRPLLEFLFPNTPEETLILYHGYIRKLAHLSEYAILAFWASRAFWSSSVNFLQKYWFIISLATVFLVASIDEYNQSFNLLRTGSIYDVWLDVSGGLWMIMVLQVWRVFKARKVKNNSY
jgi:VanZ family protein